jgi:hypothetical protein
MDIRWKVTTKLLQIAWQSGVMNVSLLMAWTFLYGNSTTQPLPTTFRDLWPIAMIFNVFYLGIVVPKVSHMQYQVNRYYLTHPPVDGTLTKKKD